MCVTSEEGLWVEKSRQPDNTRQRQILSPTVQLLTALQHIIVPDTHKHTHLGKCQSSSQSQNSPYSKYLTANLDGFIYM